MSISRPQALDFFQIEWPDFEALCRRLAEAQPETREVTAYGTQGDEQGGIDLLATRSDGARDAYQCKRVKGFGPADIDAAIERFAAGALASQVTAFVLCTAEPLHSRARLDALERARSRLGTVRLVVWDQTKLSAMLKERRDLVADVFGEAIAQSFNGPDLGWGRVGGLDVRYLVCKATDLAVAIAQGDLADVPGGATVALASPVSRAQQVLLAAGPYGYRDEIRGASYSGPEAYQTAHPDARTGAWAGEHPVLTRTPTEADLRDVVLPIDPAVATLLAGGIPTEALAAVTVQYDFCGGTSFQETYDVAPIWTVYLQVTNRWGSALHVDAVSGLAHAAGDRVARLRPGTGGHSVRQPGPGAALGPGDALLVPLATVVVPVTQSSPDTVAWGEWEHIADRVQREGTGSLSGGLAGAWTVGPTFWPTSIEARPVGAHPETRLPSPVRPFDPARLAVIDRMWGVGSCPHLFAETDGTLTYLRPLFTRTPGVDDTETVCVPSGATALVLAELEVETTQVSAVTVGGQPAAADVTLDCGQHLRIEVAAGAVVAFTGFYRSRYPAQHRPALTRQLVATYAAGWAASPAP